MRKYAMHYIVYIVRCRDSSLYCGITTDLVKRIAQHNSNSQKAAKYTWSRRPVCVVYMETQKTRSAAQEREWIIKKLSKKNKERLVDEFIQQWDE